MMNFEPFLKAVLAGETRRDLFVVASVADRKFLLQRLMDEAHAMGLDPTIVATNGALKIGESVALFRVAHAHLDDVMRGYHFTEVNGLEEFDRFDNAEEMKDRIRAQVR